MFTSNDEVQNATTATSDLMRSASSPCSLNVPLASRSSNNEHAGIACTLAEVHLLRIITALSIMLSVLASKFDHKSGIAFFT